MIELKCKTCGGTIRFKQGETIGVCDSCGTKKSLPRLDDEKLKTQFGKGKMVNEKTVRQKKFKKIAAVAALIICMCIVFFVLLTNVIVPSLKHKALCLKLNSLNVGDVVEFGKYEQDNNTSNGKEDIEWNVLAKEDNRVLLISKYALDCKQYHPIWSIATWETCSLRQWLNGTFIDSAFDGAEKSIVKETEVLAEKEIDIYEYEEGEKIPKYSIENPGNTTTDRVFLLSITDAEKYFKSDEDRKCVPTMYAVAQGAYISSSESKAGEPTCWWWLRTPGYNQIDGTGTIIGGSVYCGGGSVRYGDVCVRPAMWVSIK